MKKCLLAGLMLLAGGIGNLLALDYYKVQLSTYGVKHADEYIVGATHYGPTTSTFMTELSSWSVKASSQMYLTGQNGTSHIFDWFADAASAAWQGFWGGVFRLGSMAQTTSQVQFIGKYSGSGYKTHLTVDGNITSKSSVTVTGDFGVTNGNYTQAETHVSSITMLAPLYFPYDNNFLTNIISGAPIFQSAGIGYHTFQAKGYNDSSPTIGLREIGVSSFELASYNGGKITFGGNSTYHTATGGQAYLRVDTATVTGDMTAKGSVLFNASGQRVYISTIVWADGSTSTTAATAGGSGENYWSRGTAGAGIYEISPATWTDRISPKAATGLGDRYWNIMSGGDIDGTDPYQLRLRSGFPSTSPSQIDIGYSSITFRVAGTGGSTGPANLKLTSSDMKTQNDQTFTFGRTTLYNATGNYGNTQWRFPETNGNAGEVLTSSGSGLMAWLPAASGSASWVGVATSPLNMAGYSIYGASSAIVTNANTGDGLTVTLTGSGNNTAITGNQTDGGGTGIGVHGTGPIGVQGTSGNKAFAVDGTPLWGYYETGSSYGSYFDRGIRTSSITFPDGTFWTSTSSVGGGSAGNYATNPASATQQMALYPIWGDTAGNSYIQHQSATNPKGWNIYGYGATYQLGYNAANSAPEIYAPSYKLTSKRFGVDGLYINTSSTVWIAGTHLIVESSMSVLSGGINLPDGTAITSTATWDATAKFNAIGVSTGAIAASTGTLATNVGVSTAGLRTDLNALAISTGNFYTKTISDGKYMQNPSSSTLNMTDYSIINIASMSVVTGRGWIYDAGNGVNISSHNSATGNYSLLVRGAGTGYEGRVGIGGRIGTDLPDYNLSVFGGAKFDTGFTEYITMAGRTGGGGNITGNGHIFLTPAAVYATAVVISTSGDGITAGMANKIVAYATGTAHIPRVVFQDNTFAISTSAWDATAKFTAIGTSTAGIRTDLTALAASTGAITAVAASTGAFTAVGISTAGLRTDLTALAASTGAFAGIGTSTAGLRTDLTTLAASTGTLVKKAGDTMTGNLTNTSSITITGAGVNATAMNINESDSGSTGITIVAATGIDFTPSGLYAFKCTGGAQYSLYDTGSVNGARVPKVLFPDGTYLTSTATLATSGFVSKTGDTMNGALSNSASITASSITSMGQIITRGGANTWNGANGIEFYDGADGTLSRNYFIGAGAGQYGGFAIQISSTATGHVPDPSGTFIFGIRGSTSMAYVGEITGATIYSSGTIIAAGQVSSNGRKLVDQYDGMGVVSSPTWYTTLASTYVPISSPRSFAITITTITARAVGTGTSITGTIVYRDFNLATSTGVIAGNITISTTGWIGGTFGTASIPANTILFFVGNTQTGPIDQVYIKYTYTKD